MVKIIENPIYKIDDLGVPLFSETSTYANCHLIKYVVELGGDSWQAIWKSMYSRTCEIHMVYPSTNSN